ncbi:MAG: sodium:proton antiporter, partial [Sutterella wadsworthensis]
MTLSIKSVAAATATLLLPAAAMASDMNGAELGLAWAVPFAGILLSIALFPLFAPHIWHHHFGKISVFWALCCIIPLATVFGPDTAFHEIAHVLL